MEGHIYLTSSCVWHALKLATAFGNSNSLVKWVRDLEDEQVQLEAYCQVFIAQQIIRSYCLNPSICRRDSGEENLP